MKKGMLIIAMFASFTLQIKAQRKLAGGFDHIIEVGRYSDYGKGYLTITDANGVGIMREKYGTMNYYTYEYVGEYNNKDDKYKLYKGELILEVDGVSAAGWSKEQFYEKVDNRIDIITLKIRSKDTKSGIYDYVTKIRPLYELPDSVKMFGNIFATVKGSTTPSKRKNGLSKDTSFEERHDEDFDFFPCMTYDYYLNSSDPLLDKEILKEVNIWQTRDEKKPDLIFTIARNVDENISSTYIPPTSRVINEGSRTQAQYNFITRRNDYVTTQKNRIIQEGGYTQETKTTDVYLEIAALDAKRINDRSISYPPVVWKATAKRHILNPSSNFNMNDELKAFASWMTPPMTDRNVWAERNVYAPVGIISSEDKKIIQNVVAFSRAEKIGLMPGDILVNVTIPSSKYQTKIVKKSLKKFGWEVLEYYNQTYDIVVLRNGVKMNFTLSPVSLLVYRHYLTDAK